MSLIQNIIFNEAILESKFVIDSNNENTEIFNENGTSDPDIPITLINTSNLPLESYNITLPNTHNSGFIKKIFINNPNTEVLYASFNILITNTAGESESILLNNFYSYVILTATRFGWGTVKYFN
jgi:hypothetical protein